MKKCIAFLLLVIIGYLTKAQPNLIRNYSFEEYINCPYVTNGGSTIYSVDSNVNLKNWYGNSIYANSCANSTFKGNMVGVPENFSGYQYAKTGNAYTYIGLSYNYIFSSFHNSYISSSLSSVCISRMKYFSSFFISAIGLSGGYFKTYNAYNDSFMFCTTSNLGASLGNTSLVLDGSLQVLPAQIKNELNRDLNDTINWMEISNSFEANGTEKYITIGTFDDSSSIKFYNSYGYTKPYAGIYSKTAGYFIDDVSLIPQNTTHFYDTLLCSNAPLQLGAVTQADSFEWYDGNKTDKIRNFTAAGLVWVKSWLYGGTVYMWDSLNIIPNNINSALPKDTFLCNEQTQLNISTSNANAGATYLWNNGSTGKSLVLNNINWVNGKAQVWLTTTAKYCTQTDTVTIYQKPAIQIPINDTTTCFEDVPQILLNAGANFKSYLWLPTGETSKTVYSNQAQIYKLTVTDSFNCSANKNIVVDELCKAEIFLPNAFTPNGDGKNETYKPIFKTKNLLQYELKIYDSWGTAIFTTTDPNQAWDAKNNLQGVYVVTVNYQYKNFLPNVAKGTVTILR